MRVVGADRLERKSRVVYDSSPATSGATWKWSVTPASSASLLPEVCFEVEVRTAGCVCLG